MDLLPGSHVTAGALNAEKLRMEVIAQNIANAQTTKTEEGTPYRRQLVAFESELQRATNLDKKGGSELLKGVKVDGVFDDPSSFRTVYNPGHPHADENGMVSMPNVDLAMEMVDMIASSRSYEANLTVMKTSRSLSKQALQINYT
ncbi:MAG: flagellar basal body rod protein FlgC [Opitutales bacterium]|nr:flagellar basal body rod protein FlgC [Opitutales bacterium]